MKNVSINYLDLWHLSSPSHLGKLIVNDWMGRSRCAVEGYQRWVHSISEPLLLAGPRRTSKPPSKTFSETPTPKSLEEAKCPPLVPLPYSSPSDREIHAPPPQNRRSASQVQNWGWCVFCLFSWVPTIRTPTPQKYHLMRKVFFENGAWLAVPYTSRA